MWEDGGIEGGFQMWRACLLRKSAFAILAFSLGYKECLPITESIVGLTLLVWSATQVAQIYLTCEGEMLYSSLLKNVGFVWYTSYKCFLFSIPQP